MVRRIASFFVGLSCAAFAADASAQTFPSLAAPNQVVAGPASGGSLALPTPRSLVNLDLSSITALPSGISVPTPTITGTLTSTGGVILNGLPAPGVINGSICAKSDGTIYYQSGVNCFASGSAGAGGANTNVQYNSSGVLSGNNSFVFDGTATVTVSATNSAIVVNDTPNNKFAKITSNQGGGFPAVFWSNGTGTGFQVYEAANNAYWSIYNTADRLIVLANGNVGIGNHAASAASPLSVYQSSNTATTGLSITDAANTYSGLFWEDGFGNLRLDAKANSTGEILLNGAGGGSAGSVGIGTASPGAMLDVVGTARLGVFQGYADLREFATLSCNPGAPTSTNVAAAVYAAATAGWTHFFMPAGCFLYLQDTAWTAHYTSKTIPANFHFRGEDWVTSGISTTNVYSGVPNAGDYITMGTNTSVENMFYDDAHCYNLDSGSFGNPTYCPVGLYTNSGNSSFYMAGYPYQPRVMNVSPGNAVGGTWNGADSPGLAINQTSRGDDIFINDVDTSPNNQSDNFLNFFNVSGAAVVQLKKDGKLSLGNSSTSHSGNGVILITDSFGACQMYPNTSGSPGFSCSSDERLKGNIHLAHSQLPWLNSFDIKQFDMKSNGQHIPAGVIAQEVRRNHPEMVHEGASKKECAPGHPEGCLTVDAPSLWQMMKVMQEMQAEIVDLKRRIR